MRILALFVGLSSIMAPVITASTSASLSIESAHAGASCPPEMARHGRTCIDRWEVHTVGARSKKRLSPFYPPEPLLLKKVHDFWSTEAGRSGISRARRLELPPIWEHQRESFKAKAASAPGVLPQGYMTYYVARDSCARAGKRLCSEGEWVRACRGRRRSKHPYGANFQAKKCNVFRAIHPAYELHGNSSLGHLDPRLHLVTEDGLRPLLLETGMKESCTSTLDEGAVFDMVGNLDEWIDDPKGVFVGGFFSRQTREGCDAKIENHSPAYTDYSLGTRCCKDAR